MLIHLLEQQTKKYQIILWKYYLGQQNVDSDFFLPKEYQIRYQNSSMTWTIEKPSRLFSYIRDDLYEWSEEEKKYLCYSKLIMGSER